ncbi:uncharacterized protein BX663DRAFT_305088, partial [Cokeromyces recurvatus]|uniref:uncharacterized protein n=1 Tax=Cokeromyces recurvatus TaxID=90255 RepID=UPI002220335B
MQQPNNNARLNTPPVVMTAGSSNRSVGNFTPVRRSAASNTEVAELKDNVRQLQQQLALVQAQLAAVVASKDSGSTGKGLIGRSRETSSLIRRTYDQYFEDNHLQYNFNLSLKTGSNKIIYDHILNTVITKEKDITRNNSISAQKLRELKKRIRNHYENLKHQQKVRNQSQEVQQALAHKRRIATRKNRVN